MNGLNSEKLKKSNLWEPFWIFKLKCATANPPKSDDRYAQLTRGAFIINDFLQNPHFSD